jgi:hypothetical protein
MGAFETERRGAPVVANTRAARIARASERSWRRLRHWKRRSGFMRTTAIGPSAACWTGEESMEESMVCVVKDKDVSQQLFP